MLVFFSFFFVALSMAISIATLNINGLRDVNKRMGVVSNHMLCNKYSVDFSMACGHNIGDED